VLEVGDVGVVNVTYVRDTDPLNPIDDEGDISKLMAKAKSRMSMAIPPLQNVGEGGVKDVDGDPLALNWC